MTPYVCSIMATYYVTHVRRMNGGRLGATHDHIVGVWTSAGEFYENDRVIRSIAVGHTWQTAIAGAPYAEIHPVSQCAVCGLSPYLRTNGDRWAANNLENLPEK